MEAILLRVLSPLLDRLGTGWKSVTGLCLMALILALGLLKVIPLETGEWLFKLAEVLFGLGVVHKAARAAGQDPIVG